jgi:hypothetical protein
MRIIASDGPPAANGTTTVIGRDGKFSAKALLASASVAVNRARTVLRITSPAAVV